ncbi:MAG TPA: thioredoxin domain-containing protein [Bellilinea sp.]|nr:thioredoxin domain-containing protein [Bellilinea sp.]
MSNRLADSTSPYLLQHAQNPVDWYPWGPEALTRAKNEDKPIFLSIGYAACHWCHVMAHESFEDPKTAEIMNANFINIKVDREERPDLDNIYMSAVVALTGSGGWPMSVFLTPNLEPFYGGTYFPPVARYRLPAFPELLTSIAKTWRTQRADVRKLTEQVQAAMHHRADSGNWGGEIDPEDLAKAESSLLQSYDWESGGWGSAPKFPQPMALDFLLRRYAAGSKTALEPVIHALHAMSKGGMWDLLGGGFSRYSTDNEWLVPHFEKMLYDNAQLAVTFLHTWQVTKDDWFRQVTEETLNFVERELMHPQGGFYSSLDADSEGEEGKFYVWSPEEIRLAAGEDSELFDAVFGISDGPNWESKVILQQAVLYGKLTEKFGLTRDQIAEKIDAAKIKLLEMRASRVRPGTDDKVLAAWNGWMLSTFAQSARILDNGRYLQIAQRNADFLLTNLYVDAKLSRAWRNGQRSGQGFLEDYAALILGLLDLYQADFNPRWYAAARALTDDMIAEFTDPAGGFYDTSASTEVVLLRPKDLQDNATPSGNALAAEALTKMAAYSGNEEWRGLAEKAVRLVAGSMVNYPTAFGRWLSAADGLRSEIKEVAIVGDLADGQTKAFLAEVNAQYRPNLIVAAADLPLDERSPELLADRPLLEGLPTAYVCTGFVCQRPVNTLAGLKEQLAG